MAVAAGAAATLLLLLVRGGDLADVPEPRYEDLEGRSYAFWDLDLPWDSAQVVCQRMGMKLAAVPDAELTGWAAQKSTGGWATWLGGRRGGPETPDPSALSWRWGGTQEVVSAPPNDWVDKAPPDHCLALAATPPHLAALADMPCNTKLPFVCERADAETSNFVASLQLPDRTLTFVETLSSYDEADRMCKSFNGNLFTANTPDLAKALETYAKKLLGVWVGARADDSGVARWTATGQEVELLGERSLLLFEEDSELVVTHDEVTLKKTKRQAAKKDTCIFADRKGQFKEADCGVRKSYVCETRSKTYYPLTTDLKSKGRKLRVSTHVRTWEGARDACKKAKGTIANIRELDTINVFVKLAQEFQDMWMDGRTDDDGVWRDSEGVEIPSDRDPDGGYPPWVTAKAPTAPGLCLALYRQSVTQVLFLPRPCTEEHGFVCYRSENK